MKKIVLLLLAVLLIVSCSKDEVDASSQTVTETSDSVATDISSLSVAGQYYYAMGNYYASSIGMYYEDMDYAAFAKGAADAGNGVSLSQEQQTEIVNAYMNEQTKDNREKAEKLLEENKTKEGVVTTESGLQYKIITKGTGESAADATTVTVDYELTLTDGTVADSSIERGKPSQFNLDSLIKGFTEAIKLMHVGDTIKIWVHPDLGYGASGTGSIPGNELLTFTISLISIDK